MEKIKYSDIQFAISAAVADPKVQSSLLKREADKQLDCVEIKCQAISKVDAPEKIFEIIVNYQDVNNQPVEGEDIIVQVAIQNGRSEVINVRYR